MVLDTHERQRLKILVMFTLNLNVWLIFESARSINKINTTSVTKIKLFMFLQFQSNLLFEEKMSPSFPRTDTMNSWCLRSESA